MSTFTTSSTTATSRRRRPGPARGQVVSPRGDPLGEWNARVAAPLDDEDHEVVLVHAQRGQCTRGPSAVLVGNVVERKADHVLRPSVAQGLQNLRIGEATNVIFTCAAIKCEQSLVRKGGVHEHKATEHTYRGLGCSHTPRRLRCCHCRRRPDSPVSRDRHRRRAFRGWHAMRRPRHLKDSPPIAEDPDYLWSALRARWNRPETRNPLVQLRGADLAL